MLRTASVVLCLRQNMQLKTALAEMLVLCVFALCGSNTATAQIPGRAGEIVFNPAENPLAPSLFIPERPVSPADLADTWPTGSFVPQRLTKPPSYDPAFRLKPRVEQAAPILNPEDRRSAAAHSRKEPARKNTQRKPSSAAGLRPTRPDAIQQSAPAAPKRIKVTPPAEK